MTAPRDDAEARAEARRRAAERRRLAEIFGDLLPESTRDDAEEPDQGEGSAARDADLKREVPPHHGG